MVNPKRRPPKLADFKGRQPVVKATKKPIDPGDWDATSALVDSYTQEDGFHCPRCPFTTTDPNEAVRHLAGEINKALDALAKKGR